MVTKPFDPSKTFTTRQGSPARLLGRINEVTDREELVVAVRGSNGREGTQRNFLAIAG